MRSRNCMYILGNGFYQDKYKREEEEEQDLSRSMYYSGGDAFHYLLLCKPN